MISMRNFVFFLTSIVIAFASSRTQAATIWNEGSQGDLSGNRLSPTSGPLALGNNDLFGQTQGGDLDYITFALPAGQQLTGIFLRSYQSNDSVAFVAMQTGSTFTESDSNPNPANMRGYSHFGSGNLGSNMLPSLGGTAAGPNSYTLWLQQLGAPTSYRMDFVVVPEPTTFVLTAAGLLGFALWGAIRRRARVAV
jgi:hypothetical protein